jgi:hypothetical protein
MGNRKKAEDIQLVPMPEFKKTVRHVLSNSKKDIDKQIARIKASNRARRQTRKRKG